MSKTAAEVYRNFVTDGVPSSGEWEPPKLDIRELLTGYETIINAFTSNGGLIYQTLADLNADLAHGAKSQAWVVNDPVAGNNGVYMKNGASGAGSWTRVKDLPYSFIIASDVGAGTPNAIQATTSIPVSGSALVWMNVFEANTASPVTVSFNGGTPVTVKTNSGGDIASGGLAAGMIVLGIVSGDTFRLVSDQASAAVVAAAEAAQVAAELARDEAVAAAAAVNIPPIASGDGLKALRVKEDESGQEFVLPKLFTANVIPSTGRSRSFEERFRETPSVLDYDGVDEAGVSDSWNGFQNAINAEAVFGGRRHLLMPNASRFRLSAPLEIPYRGFHLQGASKVGTQLHPTHDGQVIVVGKAVDAAGYAPRTILEKFAIFGDGVNQTGGVVLLDKNTQPGWADASKACRLSEISVNDIGNGPGFRIQSWANVIDGCEVSGGLRGFIIEKQALTVTLIKPYITGCAKEGMIIGDTPARVETCNIEIFGGIVQQCGGAPGSGAILLRGVAGVAFYGLYLERNGEKDAVYDIDISELAVNTVIQNVTNRSPAASALFRDAGVNTKISNVWNYGATDAIVRRIGSLPTGHYENFYQANGALANGYIRDDLATGAARGRYVFRQDGVQEHGLQKRVPKTATFTPGRQESGTSYSCQSGSAMTLNLPADYPEGHIFTVRMGGGGTLTLQCAAGATINNGASGGSKVLTSGVRYTVECMRNNGGAAAEWSTSA